MVSPASSRSASHSPAPAPVRDDDQGLLLQGRPKQPSALYSMVMTPVNLTVFLVSLLIVDLRYSLARAENASSSATAATAAGGRIWPWLPAWLRRVALSLSGRGRTPYGSVPRGNKPGTSDRWHYHSKQKKLMRMEADEAFRLRGAVLAGLAALGVVGVVVLWCAGRRAVSELRRLVAAVRR